MRCTYSGCAESESVVSPCVSAISKAKKGRRDYSSDKREQYKMLRENGLCVSCKDAARPGKVHCQRCADRNEAYIWKARKSA